MYSLRIFYDKDIAFWASVWASEGLMCVFVSLCDVHHVDKRSWIYFSRVSGETTGKGTPSPSQGRATVRLPPSKFFLFFQANFLFFSTLPHKSSNLPIFFPSERFSLPLCVFPYPCIFSCLWGQKTGEIRIVFLYYLCLCGYYTLYSHFLLFSLLCFSPVSPYCFALCVMFLYCLLLWMLCFSLICLFFCPLWGFLRFCV